MDYFLLRLGRGEEAYATQAPSAAFLRINTDPIASTNSLLCLGIVCWGIGGFSEAEESFRESLKFAREYGERWYEGMASEFLGRVAFEGGDYNQTRKYLGEALTIIRQLGDPSMRAHLLSYLGRTMQVLGEFSEAEKLLRESLELAQELNYRTTTGLALDSLGSLAYSQRRYEEAEAFFSESAGLFREMGDTHRLSRTLNHQGLNVLSLNNADGARISFHVALKMAYEGGWMPAALYALMGLTALDIQQKTSQEKLELVLYEAVAVDNEEYLAILRSDLEAQRFDLIVVDPLTFKILARRRAFSEENNVWVRGIMRPILCNYRLEESFPEDEIALYVPQEGERACP